MKNTTDKAKSGQLIVNTRDIDSLVSRNVNFLPKAPMAQEECNGASALSHGFFRPPTRLSRVFDKNRKHEHDDGLGLWALVIMDVRAQYARMQPPTYDCC